MQADILPMDALPLDLVLTKAAVTDGALAGGHLHELGLAASSGGVLDAGLLRGAELQAFRDAARGRNGTLLEFAYVIEGWIELGPDPSVHLSVGDVCCQHDLAKATVAVSDDLVLFLLTAPDTAAGRALLPQRPAAFIAHDAPEAHVLGTGPRSFFDYRDLGLSEVTGGRMEIQIIRAQRPREGGTGWHWHTMSQLSLGLGGWAKLGVEGAGALFTQAFGDALCIPERVIHNAGSFSSDYCALQLQIPAVYDTVPASAPMAFADK